MQQLLGFGSIEIRRFSIHYQRVECSAVEVPRSYHIEVAALLNTLVGKFEPGSEICASKVGRPELLQAA
jgi:hypothetical protein